jgi:hypothetical protein
MSEATSPHLPEGTGENIGIVDTDRPCVRCMHNLRGVATAGKCPACGTDVAISLTNMLLQYASKEYIGTVRSGLSIILNWILISILLAFCAIGWRYIFARAGYVLDEIAIAVLGLLTTGMIIHGYFKLTAAEEGYSEPPEKHAAFRTPAMSRKIVRVAVAVQGVIAALQFVFILFVVGKIDARTEFIVTISMAVVVLILMMVQMIAVMRCIEWLALRVPDHYIIKRARRYPWQLPMVAIFGLLLLGLGPLLALVMYWNLLDRLRKHLKSILKTGVPAQLKGMTANAASAVETAKA